MREIREDPTPAIPPLKAVAIGSGYDCGDYSVGFKLKRGNRELSVVIPQRCVGDFLDNLADPDAGGSFSITKGELTDLVRALEELRERMV